MKKLAQVDILIKGYVRNDVLVVPTTSLIRDGDTSIIVDPGMGIDKENVLRIELKNHGLNFENIDYVFTTHYHLDHTRYVGLFPNAKLIDYLYIYDGNKWLEHKGDGYKISPNVIIVHTPGHSIEHASLKINTKKGIIVVAGDVWWFADLTPEIDNMAFDQKELGKSRKKLLKIADYIIPGHGEMFENKH